MRRAPSRGPKLLPLNAPAPVHVRADGGGRPTLVRRGRRPLRVTAIREEWRIDDEWWRRPVSRRYFTVILENGGTITLFLDLIEGRWYAQEG